MLNKTTALKDSRVCQLKQNRLGFSSILLTVHSDGLFVHQFIVLFLCQAEVPKCRACRGGLCEGSQGCPTAHSPHSRLQWSRTWPTWRPLGNTDKHRAEHCLGERNGEGKVIKTSPQMADEEEERRLSQERRSSLPFSIQLAPPFIALSPQLPGKASGYFTQHTLHMHI